MDDCATSLLELLIQSTTVATFKASLIYDDRAVVRNAFTCTLETLQNNTKLINYRWYYNVIADIRA